MEPKDVLFIDDDDDIRTVGEMALSMVGGWKVRTASNGHDGIAAATDTPPDLILLDVMMPGIDGIETFRRLRAEPKTAKVPVILMTAKVQPHEVESFMDTGVTGVIAKPFDPMGLPDQIRGILNG